MGVEGGGFRFTSNSQAGRLLNTLHWENATLDEGNSCSTRSELQDLGGSWVLGGARFPPSTVFRAICWLYIGEFFREATDA